MAYQNPFILGGQVGQSSTNGDNATELPSSPNFQFRPAAVFASNALSRGAEPGASSSLGGPVPVGRSNRDPNRIAEREARHGNYDPLFRLHSINKAEEGQNNRFAFEQMMFDKRTASSKAEKQQQKEEEQAKEAAFGDNKLNAAFQFTEAVAPGVINEDLFNMFKGLDPKVKAEMSDHIINMGGEQRKRQEALQEEARKAQQESAKRVFNLPSEDGKGSVPILETLGGSLKPIGGYFPAPKSTTPDPATMEAWEKAGLKLDKATQGGLTFARPKPVKEGPKIRGSTKDGDGNIINLFDDGTFAPARPAPGAPATPSKATPSTGFLKTFGK